MIHDQATVSNMLLIYYYYQYLRGDKSLNFLAFAKKYNVKESTIRRRLIDLRTKRYMKVNIRSNTFEFTNRGLANACYKWDHPHKFGLDPIRYPLLADLIRLGILEQPENVEIRLE